MGSSGGGGGGSPVAGMMGQVMDPIGSAIGGKGGGGASPAGGGMQQISMPQLANLFQQQAMNPYQGVMQSYRPQQNTMLAQYLGGGLSM